MQMVLTLEYKWRNNRGVAKALTQDRLINMNSAKALKALVHCVI
jgi:hypothetical protein